MLLGLFLCLFKSTYNQTQYHLTLNIFENFLSPSPIKTIKKSFNDTIARDLFINKAFNETILQQYYNFSYTKKNTNNNSSEIKLYRNKKFNGINIVNDSVLLKVFKPNKKKVKHTNTKTIKFDKFNFYVNNILNYYENKGFPFAEITLSNINCNDSLCAAILSIDKKELFLFDSIKIIDSSVADKYFIDKTLKFKKSEIYQQKKIDNIPTTINNIPFLTLDEYPALTYIQNKFVIKLNINEKKSNSIDGLLGFYNDEENGKIRLTGNIKTSLVNSLKTSELIDIQWQTFAAQSQQLNAMVILPYFLQTDFGISGKLELLKKDTSFSANTKRLGMQYHFNYWNYIQLYVEASESVITGDYSTAVNNANNAFYSYNALLFGTEIRYETSDNIICPTKGYFLTLDISNGTKNKQIKPEHYAYNIDSNQSKTSYSRLSSKIDGYFPILSRNVIKISNNSGWILDQRLAENELFRIGGFKTLRGFDELSIWTSAYTVFSLEYRYLFEKNSYFNIFSDAAYCEINTFKYFKTIIPISTGAGINFETKLGIFSLYYAIGKQNQQPFLVKNAKIHFGLSSKF